MQKYLNATINRTLYLETAWSLLVEVSFEGLKLVSYCEVVERWLAETGEEVGSPDVGGVTQNTWGTEVAGRGLRCVHVCDLGVPTQLLSVGYGFPYSSSAYHGQNHA